MTNLDFIIKYENEIPDDENSWYLTIIDGEIVSEIDEDDRIIYTLDDQISFDNIEDYSVWVNEAIEEDMIWDVKEFFSTVKKSIKFCNKLYLGRGEAFARYDGNGFLNAEYLTDEWNDIGTISDDLEQGITLIGMRTVKENK